MTAAKNLKLKLSTGWGDPEEFKEVIDLEGMAVELCGYAVVNGKGTTVTGSSASTEGQADIKAYFELLERAAIIEAEQTEHATFRLLDTSGTSIGMIGREAVFPKSPNPDLWNYAKSNGVASHTDLSAAIRSAACELVERDMILRAWLGQIPMVAKTSDLRSLDHLRRLYRIGTYSLGTAKVAGFDQPVHTAVIIGLPNNDTLPTMMGFGAALDWLAALSKAESECIQRLGFLWGQPVDVDEPVGFSPSAEYHLDYFLKRQGQHELAAWMDEASQSKSTPIGVPERMVTFADLTSDHLRGALFVVKAICSDMLDLKFGLITDDSATIRRVHPIA